MRKVFLFSLLSFVLVLPSVAQEKDKLVTAYVSFINYVGNGHNERLEVVSFQTSEANVEAYNGVSVVTIHFNQYDGKIEYLRVVIKNTITNKYAYLTLNNLSIQYGQWGYNLQRYIQANEWLNSGEEIPELTYGK